MGPRKRGGVKKKAGISLPPPVATLGGDLTGEILIRLPDMASLASAAFVWKPWYSVASDRSIFHRFLSLRRPPFVGFIFTDLGESPIPWPEVCFVSASPRNPDLISAAKNGDFHLEGLSVPGSETDHDKWFLRGCDGGRLLLSCGCYQEHLVVCDPLARTSVFIRRPDGWHQQALYAIVADEVDDSVWVISVKKFGYKDATVFSSRTGEWATINSDLWGIRLGLQDGKSAGRFAYWRVCRTDGYEYYKDQEGILVFDTSTMVWSVTIVPFLPSKSYCVADVAEHGGMCLLSSNSNDLCVQLWVGDNSGGWVLKKEISLLNKFQYLKKIHPDKCMRRLRIIAAKACYVYMEVWSIDRPNSYILVLNLNTTKLEIFRNNLKQQFRGPAFPFFMRFGPLPAPNDEN